MKIIEIGGWALNCDYVVGVGPVTRVRKVLNAAPDTPDEFEVFVQVCHGNDLRTVSELFKDEISAQYKVSEILRRMGENVG